MAEENDATVDAQGAEPTEEPKAPEADLDHWKSMSRKNERDAKAARTERDAALAERDRASADLDAANARIAELENIAYPILDADGMADAPVLPEGRGRDVRRAGR